MSLTGESHIALGEWKNALEEEDVLEAGKLAVESAMEHLFVQQLHRDNMLEPFVLPYFDNKTIVITFERSLADIRARVSFE